MYLYITLHSTGSLLPKRTPKIKEHSLAWRASPGETKCTDDVHAEMELLVARNGRLCEIGVVEGSVHCVSNTENFVANGFTGVECVSIAKAQDVGGDNLKILWIPSPYVYALSVAPLLLSVDFPFRPHLIT